MITCLNYDDLLIVNDLEELGNGRYMAVGDDPYFEIKNLPEGLIQDISIELKAENGKIIEFYWTYGKNESYSPALRSIQRLKPGTMSIYKFLVDPEKRIKRLRLDPTNASGIIEIRKIKISYIIKDKNKPEDKINIENQMNSDYDLLVNSGLFDIDWYIEEYGDVDLARKDPVNHYLEFGADKGFNPNQNFNTNWYLKLNPDVSRSDMNPLVHFILFGSDEGRDPHPLFSISRYLKENPDVAVSGMNPLLHYVKYGITEGRKACPFSDNIEFIHYLENLKLTLKGKDGYLFLINDSNNEIRQHFDQSYTNTFKMDIFMKNFNFKKNICDNKNIRYFFFIVPDKSLVCKDFLPFDIKLIKRNYNLLTDLIPDFAKNLDHACYFKSDSHINYLGGKELTYYYLNYINPNFKRDNFNKLINEQISITTLKYNGDLTWEKNCSYSDEEKKECLNEEIASFSNKYLVNLNKDLPEKFKVVGIRKTEYYKNEHGLTNSRVLILRDSSLDYLKDILSVYFNEILLYWDHWFFNKELFDWYKPDILLEIRTERFLENMELK